MRPQIDEADEDDDEEAFVQAVCTAPISNVIRQCWVKEPKERPKLNWVIAELVKEKGYFKLNSNNSPLSHSLN